MEKGSLTFIIFAVETFFLCVLKIYSMSAVLRTADIVQILF